MGLVEVWTGFLDDVDFVYNTVPVYKCPVFRQSSPKLDLIDNINILESSPSASPFPTSYINHSESSLATLETSTPSKYSPPVHS